MIYLSAEKEIEILNLGYSRVIGIDEVGRGCWAGPVVVGGFEFSSATPHLSGVTDSKLLTPLKRENLHLTLKNSPHILKWADAKSIDKLGIGKTIEKLVMEIVDMYNKDTYFLLDGRFSTKFGANVETVVGGDRLFYSIAAASVIAKVERDNFMKDLSQSYSGYGFEKHKGYGTKQHSTAISALGLSDVHRKSYKISIR